MAWPVAIPSTVSGPAQSAASSALRFDRLVGRSIPLDQIDAALAEAAKVRADTLRSMKALKAVRREAKADQAKAARDAAKYLRDEARLTAERDTRVTGERMAAAMQGAPA